jgi:hypothetical protein
LPGVVAVIGVLVALVAFLGSSIYLILAVSQPATPDISSNTYFFTNSFSINLSNSQPTILQASSRAATGFSVTTRAGRITLTAGRNFAISTRRDNWTIRGCSRHLARPVIRTVIAVGASDTVCMQDRRSMIATIVTLRYVSYERVRLQILAAAFVAAHGSPR